MARPKQILIEEMFAKIVYPLDAEWTERLMEDFEEWLAKEGSSQSSIYRFATRANAAIGEAEMYAELGAKGD